MLHVSTLNIIFSIPKVRSNDEMVKLCGDACFKVGNTPLTSHKQLFWAHANMLSVR